MQLELKNFKGIMNGKEYRITPEITEEHVVLKISSLERVFNMYFRDDLILRIHENTPESVEKTRLEVIKEAERKWGIDLIKKEQLNIA